MKKERLHPTERKGWRASREGPNRLGGSPSPPRDGTERNGGKKIMKSRNKKAYLKVPNSYQHGEKGKESSGGNALVGVRS